MGATKPRPPLSRKALARRNELVIAHIDCVRRAARAMAGKLPSHRDARDLMGPGFIGLLEAASNFELRRGVKFKAFADQRIRGAMLDYLRSIDTLSRESRALANRLRRAERDATKRLARTPLPQDIADQLGVSLDEYREQWQKIAAERPIPIDDGERDLAETIVDRSAVDGLTRVLKRERIGILEAAIRRLPPRTQQVLSLYYSDELGHRQIGEIMGFTESRSCQILKEATYMLRLLLDPAAMGEA